MRSWIAVPGTTTGRLVSAALELFGLHGYAAVAVVTIASRAGVTTGSLYHHFGSKQGLYCLVRADVEQRVIDRFEGAAATSDVEGVPQLAPVLLVGFDYLVSSGYARLLGETLQESSNGITRKDPVEELVDRLLGGHQRPLPALVAAAWRTALWHASDGPHAAHDARVALTVLLSQS